jgi:hypothetical protein
MQAAWEKLLGATLVLTSSEPIKHRVVSAYSDYLQDLDPADLPKDLRAEFRALVTRLSCASPLRGESAVIATVRKMSNQDIEECATTVVRLLSLLRTSQGYAAESSPSVVPLYPAFTETVPPLLAVNRA